MEELQKGDIVYLKSGSPAMTILFFNVRKQYLCSWFDGKNEQRAEFSKEALTKINPAIKKAPQLGKVI